MPKRITPRPANVPTPPTVVGQHIDRLHIEAGLDVNGNIDPLLVFMSFDIVEIRDDGTDGARSRHQYALAQWPAAVKTAALDLRAALFTALENQGLIEAGNIDGEIP